MSEKTLAVFQRRIRQALAKMPVQEHGAEVVLLTPFETPSHEAISIHLRRVAEAYEFADGGTLHTHYDAARSDLEKPPRGFDRLLKFYDCEVRNGEVVKATSQEGLVLDAMEYFAALSALAALTATLTSKSSNPFPSEVQKDLKDRGYGVGPGRLEISNLQLRYDIEYAAKNMALLCVGGPLARIAEPEAEVHRAIDRILNLEKFTNKQVVLVVDPANDWWREFEQPLRKVQPHPVAAGQELYTFLGDPK